MLSDDISPFAGLEDEGHDDGLGEEGENIPWEMKYLPVKTEMIEVEVIVPPGINVTDEEIGDHFLNSFNNTADKSDGSNEDALEENKRKRGRARKCRSSEALETKRRKETRNYRTRQREKMTPEEREEPLRVPREKMRDQHAQASTTSRRTRSSGKGALIKSIVEEENGEGVELFRSNSETRAPRSSGGSERKRRTEMTEEEREAVRAKQRELMRRKRARERETMTPEEREEFLRVQREKRRVERAQASTASRRKISGVEASLTKSEESGEGVGTSAPRSSGRSGRKRRNEMTEEECEALKAKRREETRNYRARQRAAMTAEELEEFRRVQRERKRALRASLTPEQHQEELQRIRLRRIEQEAEMTEDERKMLKMNKYLQVMARMGRMSREEMEERKRRRQEYNKQRLARLSAQLTADDLEERRRRLKQYRDNMTPERKERFLAKAKSYYRRRREREDPEKSAQLLARQKERERLKAMGLKPMRRRKEQNEHHPPNELKKTKRKCVRRAPPNETPEEKAHRIREAKKRTLREIRMRRKLEIQKLVESGVGLDQIQRRRETPEQRERRLIRYRINCAKRSLRQRLEKCGVPTKEIDVKLNELQETYQPTLEFRPYKPRPKRVKQVTENDLALRTEVMQTKPDVVPPSPEVISKQSSASSSSKSATRSSARAPKGRPRKVQQPETLSAEANMHPLQHKQFVTSQQSEQYHVQTQQVQQSQAPGQQTSSNPCQTMSDIGYHDTTKAGTAAPAAAASSLSTQVSYKQVDTRTPDGSSHHGDYASSYDNHSPPPPSSPPGDDDHGHSGDATRPIQKRGRSRQDGPARPKKPSSRPPGPRGPKKTKKPGLPRDSICDECGNAYSHNYMLKHKKEFHNPNYKDQMCQICGEKFTVAKHWYRHYRKSHYVKPVQDFQKNPYICDVCGDSFRLKCVLEKHKYKMHGDGLKKENWKHCPVCPGEVLFKDTENLYRHLYRIHPGYNRGSGDCYRCDKIFAGENELRLHVQVEHVDSYFPCQYCNAWSFTKLAQNAHYVRCKKIPKEKREEMRKQEYMFNWENAPLLCEFCNRTVVVSGLTRHYWEMHNLRDEEFRCPDCGKKFRIRSFWAVHMEEMHLKPLDEMTELVRRLNVANREGLVVKNPRGVVVRGVKRNTLAQEVALKRKELLLFGGVEKKASKGKRSRGGRNQKKQIVVTSEEEEEGMESSASENETDDEEEQQVKSKKRPRRNIKVIAEEDDDEKAVDNEQEVVRQESAVSWPETGPKSKTEKKKQSDSKEEEDDYHTCQKGVVSFT